MNLDNMNKLFQAFHRDKPGSMNVKISIDVGSGKLPVTIPVQNILIENDTILVKGEIANIDVLNKTKGIGPPLPEASPMEIKKHD
jgi:hypothetical protein